MSDTNHTANDAASKRFERLARANLFAFANSLAYAVSSVQGKERLGGFAIDCARRGISVDNRRAHSTGTRYVANSRDNLDPKRLDGLRSSGSSLRFVFFVGRRSIGGAEVGAIQSPGPTPGALHKYASRDERAQREKQVTAWQKKSNAYRALSDESRFLLVPLNNPIPAEVEGGSADVLVVMLDADKLMEPAELPEGAQAMLDDLLVQFVRGDVERLEVIEERERREMHLARRARKKARESQAAKKAG